MIGHAVPMGYGVRDYVAGDEPSWLRCRVLSSLGTAHHDPVVTAKPEVSGAELVAVDRGVVVGILDVAVDGELATIGTIAVHPDHQHRGIGGALLSHARARARALGATTLDAWTLDDPTTSRWYRAMGFSEREHHPHVAAEHGTSPQEPVGPRLSKALADAGPADGTRWRRGSARARGCRRFALPLTSRGQLGRRGDEGDHRAVARDGHRQR